MTQKLKVLLTGARGMMGRNILEHPAARHFEWFTPGSNEVDLTDYAATNRYMNHVRPDVVIHSAGLVGGIQANMAHPVDFLVVNADLGRNVVLASRQTGVKRLVNLASSCMYPREGQNPLPENAILTGELEPTNEGYALAKIYTMRLCQYIRRETPEFQYKTLIPCNLYGRHDKFDPKHSHLVPAVIHKIHQAKQRGEVTVDIWGDGLARREFMFATDCADAVMRAVIKHDTLPEVMNVGLGCDYTINEYYETAARVIGWVGEFAHDLSKPVGMRQKLVDTQNQTAWGWTAQTSLEAGMRATYDFYLEHFKP